MLFKLTFFSGHLLLIKSSFFIYKPFLFLMLHTFGLYYNDNNCILTQIEDKLFGETLIDQYNRVRGKCIVNNRFRVPGIIDILCILSLQ